jgi:hypothetical protein
MHTVQYSVQCTYGNLILTRLRASVSVPVCSDSLTLSPQAGFVVRMLEGSADDFDRSTSQAPLRTRCQWLVANRRPARGDRAGCPVFLCRHVLLTLAPLNSLPGSPVSIEGLAMLTARGLVTALFASDTQAGTF